VTDGLPRDGGSTPPASTSFAGENEQQAKNRTDFAQNPPDSGGKMKFPRTIAAGKGRNRAEVVIYGKKPSNPFYRIAWYEGGRRDLKTHSTYTEALAAAEAKAKALADKGKVIGCVSGVRLEPSTRTCTHGNSSCRKRHLWKNLRNLSPVAKGSKGLAWPSQENCAHLVRPLFIPKATVFSAGKTTWQPKAGWSPSCWCRRPGATARLAASWARKGCR
jgi:hypothetical protein